MKFRPTLKINQSIMENNLNQSFISAMEAAQDAINAIQGYRRMINENHLVHLPTQNLNEIELCEEIETEINGILYLVNFEVNIKSVKTHPGDPEEIDYTIEIVGIWQSPVADVDSEYVPLDKIEKNLFDQLIQKCNENITENMDRFVSDYEDESCAHDQVAHD